MWEVLFDSSADYIFVVFFFHTEIHHDIEQLFFRVLIEVHHSLHFLLYNFTDLGQEIA